MIVLCRLPAPETGTGSKLVNRARLDAPIQVAVASGEGCSLPRRGRNERSVVMGNGVAFTHADGEWRLIASTLKYHGVLAARFGAGPRLRSLRPCRSSGLREGRVGGSLDAIPGLIGGVVLPGHRDLAGCSATSATATLEGATGAADAHADVVRIGGRSHGGHGSAPGTGSRCPARRSCQRRCTWIRCPRCWCRPAGAVAISA